MALPVVIAHAGHVVVDLIVFLGPVAITLLAFGAHALHVRRRTRTTITRRQA